MRQPPGKEPGGRDWASAGEYDTPGLSRPGSKTGRLQRALLTRLRVHEREASLPTSARFLFYELVQAGVVSKERTGARRPDQPVIDALTHLREAGLVPWHWISDESREFTAWRTSATVAEYVLGSLDRATLDPWAGDSPPVIVCESRTVAGALDRLAARYAAPITSVGGQCKGHLINEVAPNLQAGQRILYCGDWDWCGLQIEERTKAVLIEHAGLPGISANGVADRWERLLLTTATTT